MRKNIKKRLSDLIIDPLITAGSHFLTAYIIITGWYLYWSGFDLVELKFMITGYRFAPPLLA